MKLRMAIWRTNLRIPTCPVPRLSCWQVLVTYLLVWAKLSFLRGLNPCFSYASLFRVADVSVQSYTKARDTKTCPEITWVLCIPSCHHCLSKSIPPSFCSSGSIFPARIVTLFLPTGPWTWEVQSVPVKWDSFCVSWQEYIYFGPGMLTMQSPELQKWKVQGPQCITGSDKRSLSCYQPWLLGHVSFPCWQSTIYMGLWFNAYNGCILRMTLLFQRIFSKLVI